MKNKNSMKSLMKDINNINAILNYTPNTKLTNPIIKSQIIRCSDIFDLLEKLLCLVLTFFLINATMYTYYNSSKYPTNISKLIVSLTLILYLMFEIILKKFRYSKLLEFAENNYLKSILFKSEYINVYKKRKLLNNRSNPYKYYIQILNEQDKKVNVRTNEFVYLHLKKDNSLNKKIYVLKFPTYSICNKFEYVVMLIDNFENTSYIKETSKQFVQ